MEALDIHAHMDEIVEKAAENFNAMKIRKPRNVANCTFLNTKGVCGRSCLEGRDRCGRHYHVENKFVPCKGDCGKGTKSVTGFCPACGQCRAHQTKYYESRKLLEQAEIGRKLFQQVVNEIPGYE